MSTIHIRDACFDDIPRILDIYGYYVKNTAVSFEYEVPTYEEFKSRMINFTKRFPYLVIEVDGEVKGYTYASPFIGRSACDWACELTIYLDHHMQRCGLGKKLYTELEERLKSMGIVNLYASIAYPEKEDEYLTKNSAEFHQSLGFNIIGTFRQCGYKFQRWYHLIWVEKIIGSHLQEQPPVKYECGRLPNHGSQLK